jgi:hypothetical protein
MRTRWRRETNRWIHLSHEYTLVLSLRSSGVIRELNVTPQWALHHERAEVHRPDQPSARLDHVAVDYRRVRDSDSRAFLSPIKTL